MPRPVRRPYQKLLKMLTGIALDEGQPVALRLRSSELALAIRTGVWQIASSRATQKAVRELVPIDSVDRELLRLAGVVNQLRRETKRMADALETPEQKRDREIDELIAKASKQKEQNANENQSVETNSGG